MILIRIEEARLEAVLATFKHHVTVLPIYPHTTYYVADRVVETLEREQIPFERVTDDKVVQFAEQMLRDVNEAFQNVREGKGMTIDALPPSSARLGREITRRIRST